MNIFAQPIYKDYTEETKKSIYEKKKEEPEYSPYYDDKNFTGFLDTEIRCISKFEVVYDLANDIDIDLGINKYEIIKDKLHEIDDELVTELEKGYTMHLIDNMF